MPEILSLDRSIGHYDVVYVSPHLDDAAFSCAEHVRLQLKEGKKVLVVSVFSAGPSVDESKSLGAPLKVFLDLETRREEDQIVMRELGVDHYYMDLKEVLMRHPGPKCLPSSLRIASAFLLGLMRRDKDVQLQVTHQLQRIVAKSSCEWLIGPAGIGCHPDHLLVHKACCRVANKLKISFYHDFPYSTYPVLVSLRRWMLDMRFTLRDVEIELTPEQVARRKCLVAMYDSQVKACFSNLEQLEATVEGYPQERLLEPVVAGSEDGNGARSPTKMLSLMLLVDLIATFMAFWWAHSDVDGGDFRVPSHAMRSAYTVFSLSVLRVSCFVLQILSLDFARWLCVASMCFSAVAFSFTAGVQCLSLTMYYVLQAVLVYGEQKYVQFFSGDAKRQSPPTDSPLKILVISDYMPPQTHGISTHASGIVGALRLAGHQVHVYTTVIDKRQPADSTFKTFAVPNPWNTDVRLSILPSVALMRAVLFGDFDIVHVIFPSLILWLVLFSAWLSGKPSYVSQHCSETLGRVYSSLPLYYGGLLAYSIWSALPTRLFATINAGPTYNFIHTNMFLKHYSSERVAVVPSSVDSNLFHCSEDQRKVDRQVLKQQLGLAEDDERPLWLLVSRLAPEKDVTELLRGLKYHIEENRKLQDGSCDPLLIIAGGGPLQKKLEEEVRADDLPVRFLGLVPHSQVASLYRACDVCATNSVHETFGLTVIESLACGCPMVMPHCDVFDELYGDVLGCWMYRKGDVADLAQSLKAGSQRSAKEYMAALRRDRSFNPNLFWSWNEAAKEQVAQYHRCMDRVQFKHRCFNVVVRYVLMALSVLTIIALLVILGP